MTKERHWWRDFRFVIGVILIPLIAAMLSWLPDIFEKADKTEEHRILGYSKFHFYYQYQDVSPGRRDWTYKDGRWYEEYQNGTITSFKELKESNVYGCDGLVLERLSDPDGLNDRLLVFLPKKSCADKRAWFKRGSQEWRELGELKI